jgi:aspartate/tyrosine/aromatic aminotransferase
MGERLIKFTPIFRMGSMTFFDHIPLLPPDSIVGLQVAVKADKRPSKVNLSIGVYQTEALKTPLLDAVRHAESEMLAEGRNREYLPIDGDKSLIEELGKLVFGERHWKKSEGTIAGFQAVGGTGALRLSGEFLKAHISGEIHISDPTWANHRGVFIRCGLGLHNYPYYDFATHELNFDAMMEGFKKLPEKSVVLLHACCHNPTGKDPTPDQWRQIRDLFVGRKLIPFFDLAYQGFHRGLDEDAHAVRLFAEAGIEMLVVYSCAKNFSLYAERVGALFVCAQSETAARNISSQIKILIRTLYSNPPIHGAQIVARILKSPILSKEWEAELMQMRKRTNQMRKAFAEALSTKIPARDFDYITSGAGMFCYSGLSSDQVNRLIAEHALYLPQDGRLNLAGLTPNNLDFVTTAIASVS